MEKTTRPPQRRRTGYHQPAVIDSLVKLSARVAAPHLKPEHRDLLPEEMWPHLQRHMHEEEQQLIFRECKSWGPGGHHLRKHYQYNKDGMFHGATKDWRKDGTLSSISEFADGEAHGVSEFFGVNGKLTKRGHFNIGVLDGLEETWYETGQLSSVTNYDKDLLHGESTTYHANGRWKQHGFYKDGKKTGDWIEWFVTGRPQSVVGYDDDGKKQGTILEWHPSGQLLASKEFLNDKRHGETLIWGEYGGLDQYEVYEYGQKMRPTWG